MNEMATVTALKTEGDPPVEPPADELKERKQTSVETLRAALLEAEALAGMELPPDIDDETPTPDDEPGREDVDADEPAAGPEDPPPTEEDTERMRLELLERLDSVMEE